MVTVQIKYRLIGAVDDNLAVTRSRKELMTLWTIGNGYVRRSVNVWAKGMEQDKINAYMTFTPLVRSVNRRHHDPVHDREIYQNLVEVLINAPESIHLCDFPTVNEAIN